VLVHQPKDQGDNSELNQELTKENSQEIANRLTAGKQRREYYEDNYAGEPQIELEHPDVEGKQGRTNNLTAKGDITLLLATATGHKQWMAMLLEDALDLGLGKRSFQFAFLILDLP
jgi:hypothetical protein